MVHDNRDAAALRRAAVAGRFYPRNPAELANAVRRYLDDAKATDVDAPRALIVPHAGYICSGVVAAAGFRTLTELPPGQYTVYLMGPAHWIPVHGVGLSGADSFATPLSVTPVATDKVRELVGLGAPYHLADDAHAPEHCLEVELPFLQTVLSDFRIVPMLFDEAADPERVADDLVPLLDQNARSLVVVSSDLSHYLLYEQAQQADRTLLDAVAAGDTEAARQGQACGLIPILALMLAARRLEWTAHVADYRNSGDTCSPRNEVVGYGAVVYTA
jgi:MEMO1 family protein